MLKRLFGFLISASFSVGIAGPVRAQNCGDTVTPCTVAGGTCHRAMPGDGVDVKRIVMHLHGGGGRWRDLSNSGLAKGAAARGYAFVAPDGYHPDFRFVRSWSVRASRKAAALRAQIGCAIGPIARRVKLI